MLDPSRWAVLYLGSAKVADLDTDREIVAIDRKGEIEENQRAILEDIEGIVLLDGTWSQAKALWWRNAWMLKCQRVILGPAQPSRYGKLRKEPRRDGLSTIEAAAMLLGGLEKRPDIAETLHASFERMLAKYREVQGKMPELAPKPKKKDYRRRKRALSEESFGVENAFKRGVSPLVAYIGQAVYEFAPRGHVAEWLRNGLQNRVHQFNSGRGLQSFQILSTR